MTHSSNSIAERVSQLLDYDPASSTKRPPNDRGQGRKPLDEADKLVVVPIRMNRAQKEKMGLLGGAQWVRDRIDKAKAP